MANYQLPMGIFDPNSDYARQMAADEEERQRTAQQIVQQMNQQQATPTVTVQQPAQPQTVPMPNNNALAATAASALTPLTMGEQQFASIFKGLKSDYDVAKAANDVAGMQNAHTKAEAYADMAKRFGLDLDRIGRNDSADQLTARLDANRAAILNNISQMVSAPEFCEQQFNKYKAQGVSNGRAREMALNDTEAYEGKYNRIIGDAVPLYGANNKGEMDAIGTVLMNRMYQQSPQSVALYDQYLVNPHDLWKFDKNVDVMNLQHGFQNDTMDRKFNYNMAAQQNQQNFAEHMALLNQALGLDTEEKRLQFANKYPEAAALIYGRRSGGGSGNGTGISVTKQMDALGKLAGLKSALMNKSMSVSEFEQKASELLPFVDGDTAQKVNELRYVRNFLDEYEAGNDKKALEYWNAIEDDDQLLGEVPAEIVADMRKRTASSKKNGSSAGGSVTAAPTNVDQATKAWAASIVGDAQQRAEEEKQRHEQKSREAYAALDRWRNGGY